MKLTSLLLLPLLTVSASAMTIYSDDFSGLATDPLNGQAPDIRPGTEVWTASSNIAADGDITATFGASSWLPIAFESGYIYTISTTVDIVYQNGSTTFAGVGFTSNSPLTTGATTTNAAFLRANRGGSWNFMSYSSTAEASAGDNTLFSSTQNAYPIRMEIDTSGPNWTVTGYFNDTQVDLNGASAGMAYTYTTNPTITGVGITYGSSSQAFHSFTLTAVAVPEPSEYALLLGALCLGLLVWRRRR